jgi:hypothetical protein
VTCRLSPTCEVKVPEVPRIVNAEVPDAAPLAAVRVSVLAPLAFTALNVPVTPVGNPETPRVTLPVKPVCFVI